MRPGWTIPTVPAVAGGGRYPAAVQAKQSHERSDEEFWRVDSSPFSADPPPPQPCRVVLRQVGDSTFALEQPLVITWPLGGDDAPPSTLVVPPAWVPATDLASIPDYLGWFARRFGRHTPAAVVHDVLIPGAGAPWPPDLPAEWRLAPADADRLFRQLLSASGVPPVRAALMWAAVAARTRWQSGWWGKLSLVLWGLLAVAGSAAFVAGLRDGDAALVAASLVAPAVAALLWGREYVAGVVAGYSLWWIVFGSAPAWLAYKLYQAVEWLVWRLRCLFGSPPEPRQPAAPVPYPER
jgi:Protein of unknown function (DUF1353)